jgi:hypothetical protein
MIKKLGAVGPTVAAGLACNSVVDHSVTHDSLDADVLSPH